MPKRALVVVVALLWAVPTWAQTRVQYKVDAAANPFATDGIAELTPDAGISVGNTVCVGIGLTADRTVSSVTDNGSTPNTYTLAVTANEAATPRSAHIYCTIAGFTATQITVTVSSAIASGSNLFMAEWSGAHASDSIGGTASGTTAVAGTSHSSGTLTVQGSSSVLWGFTYGTTGAYNIDADYTADSDTNVMVVGENAVTASEAMDNTTDANETSATVLVEILPAAGGGGGGCTGGLLLLGAGKCD